MADNIFQQPDQGTTVDNQEQQQPDQGTQQSTTDQKQQPDLIMGKYKTQQDLINAHAEAQAKITDQGVRLKDFTGAPKDGYEINLEDGVNSPTEGALNYIQEFGKEAGLSNDGLNKLVNGFQKHQQQEQQEQIQELIKKIGPSRIQDINNYINTLPEDKQKAMRQIVNSEDSFNAFEYLINQNKPAGVINETKSDIISTPIVTQDELDEAINKPNEYGGLLIQSDPSYAKKIKEMTAKFINLRKQ